VNTIHALGFVEVYGLATGIEAADAMLKSAQVRLLRQYEVHPGLITLTIEGDLAACRAAVSAGVAAASRIGTVISSNVMGRPDEDTETMVLDLIPKPPVGKAPPPPDKLKAPPVSLQSPDAVDKAIEFIAKAKRGRSWHEIVKHFPGSSQDLRKALDAHVESGRLNKIGARYRKPEPSKTR